MPAATSTELRERIICWFYDFQSRRFLSGCSQSTIHTILQLYDTCGAVTNPLTNPLVHRTGRKCLLDPQDLRYIQSILEARPTMYLDEIQGKLFQNCEIVVSLATLSSWPN
jgi:hypothetical protein